MVLDKTMYIVSGIIVSGIIVFIVILTIYKTEPYNPKKSKVYTSVYTNSFGYYNPSSVAATGENTITAGFINL